MNAHEPQGHSHRRVREAQDPDLYNPSTTHLGGRLRAARNARGLTQAQAADAAGIARNTLVSLERAQHPDPRLSTLLRLMRVYGLGSLEELLGELPSHQLAETWAAEGWTITR